MTEFSEYTLNLIAVLPPSPEDIITRGCRDGNYISKCCDCESEIMTAKGAFRCKECATKAYMRREILRAYSRTKLAEELSQYLDLVSSDKVEIRHPDASHEEIIDISNSLKYASAKVAQLELHLAKFREWHDAHFECGCGYDYPGDICDSHSPVVSDLLLKIANLTYENKKLKHQLDMQKRA